MKLHDQHLRLGISNNRFFHLRYRSTIEQIQQTLRNASLHRMHHRSENQTAKYLERLRSLDLAAAGIEGATNFSDDLCLADNRPYAFRAEELKAGKGGQRRPTLAADTLYFHHRVVIIG